MVPTADLHLTIITQLNQLGISTAITDLTLTKNVFKLKHFTTHEKKKEKKGDCLQIRTCTLVIRTTLQNHQCLSPPVLSCHIDPNRHHHDENIERRARHHPHHVPETCLMGTPHGLFTIAAQPQGVNLGRGDSVSTKQRGFQRISFRARLVRSGLAVEHISYYGGFRIYSQKTSYIRVSGIV